MSSEKHLVPREELMLKPAYRPPWHLSGDVEQRAARACTFPSFSATLDHHARHNAILIYRYLIGRTVVSIQRSELIIIAAGYALANGSI